MINRKYIRKDNRLSVLFSGESVYRDIKAEVTSYHKNGYIDAGNCFDRVCSFDDVEKIDLSKDFIRAY